MTIENAYPSGGAAVVAQQFKYMFRDIDTAISGSTSTSAMKIQWFTCDTAVTVNSVIAGIEGKASETYQVFVIEESDVTPKEVAAVVATSLALTQSAIADTKMSGWEFEFAEDFKLVAGKKYAFCFTLTSEAVGTACRISFDSDGFVPSPDITRGDASHVPRNTAPTVGVDLTGTNFSTFTIICGLRYSRT